MICPFTMAGSVMFISGSGAAAPRFPGASRRHWPVLGSPPLFDFLFAEFGQLSDLKNQRIRQSVWRCQSQFPLAGLRVGSHRDLERDLFGKHGIGHSYESRTVSS